MMAEHRHLVDQGAKLVELRLDYIRGEVNINRLLTDRPCPVLISCRREQDGGRFAKTEEQRQLLLRTAIAEGVDYVDLEHDIAGEIPRFGKTKRIVSLHDFRKTPDESELRSLHARLAKLDPDFIKLCTMANQPDDNFRMLRLVEQAQVPTIGLCMGEFGIPSRILTGKFGSPFTFATFSKERALAPGQLSFDEMVNVYHYDSIDSDTEIYGVIGDPIGHSMSPLIHNAAFRHLGLNKVYIPIRVPREGLSRFVDEAPAIGLKGLSVTIPHKEAVLSKFTKADDAVRGIEAANTLIFDGDQRLGYNTDYRAAMDSLEAVLGPDRKDDLGGSTSLVLGAGGVGKAIAYGLVRRKAKVVLTDGDHERALVLAEKLGCHAVEWSLRHSVTAQILVNCTPIGMHPNVDETPFDKHHLRPGSIVFDAVYNPENTILVKDARERSCKVITGVEMFVRQACLQFQYFTGHEGPADLMRDTIKRATAAVKY
jgi:3-dehydroquinate dehydratase/shikimate dehydrogenase